MRRPTFSKRVSVERQMKMSEFGGVVGMETCSVSLAQPATMAVVDDEVFQQRLERKQQRQRREADAVVVANFIPFSEYDARRVQILKVEQNDFMALPKRLADKTPQVLQQG